MPQFYKLLIKVWWFPCAEPAYLPNGESPKNVSESTLPVFRSRTLMVVTSPRRLIVVRFDDRLVKYDFAELDEISLAYAITIHKSQGSEFPAVVIPLATQHYMLLQRNLIYTGITRGKKLVVVIGQRKALGIAVRNDRPQRRYSGLLTSLRD